MKRWLQESGWPKRTRCWFAAVRGVGLHLCRQLEDECIRTRRILQGSIHPFVTGATKLPSTARRFWVMASCPSMRDGLFGRNIQKRWTKYQWMKIPWMPWLSLWERKTILSTLSQLSPFFTRLALIAVGFIVLPEVGSFSNVPKLALAALFFHQAKLSMKFCQICGSIVLSPTTAFQSARIAVEIASQMSGWTTSFAMRDIPRAFRIWFHGWRRLLPQRQGWWSLSWTRLSRPIGSQLSPWSP